MVITDLRRIVIGLLFLLKITEEAPSSFTDWESSFSCNDDSGYFPDPKDCAAYYKCNFGVPIKEVCSPGTYFNEIIHTCDWPSSVNCTQIDGRGVRFKADPVRYEMQTSFYFDPQTVTTKSIPTTSSTPSTTPYTTTVYPTPIPGSPAVQCTANKCRLPYCWCNGLDNPGNLTTDETPQMVLLSFENAVNSGHFSVYTDVFKNGRNNPNGCGILGTFFVSHAWTEYPYVTELFKRNHEIAPFSERDSYTNGMTKDQWYKEIIGQKKNLQNYAKISESLINGMRASNMKVGGNEQFQMLFEENFLYDASISLGGTIFPFTLDYAFSDCLTDICPNNSYPGVWEIPQLVWVDDQDFPCGSASSCHYPNSSQGVYEVLKKNFDRNYFGNRAPFSVAFDPGWFFNKLHREGFDIFIKELLSKTDVWFVTMSQAIAWLQNPTPLTDILNFKPWDCKKQK